MKDYVLGRNPAEYRRLAVQAELMKPMTRHLFADAGIGPGMHVIDLGSGAGDVAMLLSEMVGPAGKVTGIDIDPEALAFARTRVNPNVEFFAMDIQDYEPAAPVDAIVGRLVLMYHPDPTAALRALVRHLKPGGVAAFIEPWFRAVPGAPNSVISRTVNTVIETMRLSGAHNDLGIRIHKVFAEAGLQSPQMRFEMLADGREDSPIFQYIADTLTSLLPKAVEYGVANAEDFDLSTLAESLKAEIAPTGYAMVAAPVIAAWAAKAG